MNRYDRQLRLWGSEGQKLISESHICLVGPETMLLQECFKNLALLGTSKFSWVRSNTDGPREDLFYSDLDTELSPLNPAGVEISKFWLVDSSKKLHECQFWAQFSVIMIVSEHRVSSAILHSMEQSRVPVIPLFSSGVCGYVYIRTTEPHLIIDTHPDYQVPLLHLGNPWPELSQFLSKFKLMYTSALNCAQLPYVVLLYNALQRMKMEDLDVTTKNVRETLEKWYLGEDNPDGAFDLNYDEAVRFAHLCSVTDADTKTRLCKLARELRPVNFTNSYNRDISTMISALDDYVAIYFSVMVTPGLPDMESSNAIYRALESVYLAKARSDGQNYRRILDEKSSYAQMDPSRVDNFCQNFRNVDRMHPSVTTLADFFDGAIDCSYDAGLLDILKWQVGNNLHPTKLERDLNIPASYPTASFIAGLACQEAVKLITHQYTPVHNVTVYNSNSASPTTNITI